MSGKVLLLSGGRLEVRAGLTGAPVPGIAFSGFRDCRWARRCGPWIRVLDGRSAVYVGILGCGRLWIYLRRSDLCHADELLSGPTRTPVDRSDALVKGLVALGGLIDS